jgi:hypothetical protein
MNRTFRLIVVVSIVFLNAAFIYGQEKSLEKWMFRSIVDQAFEDLEGKTYRRLNVYETFNDRNGAPVKTVKTMTERIAPDRFRLIDESKGQKIEKIQIGSKTYQREGTGEWKEGKSSSGLIIGGGCGSVVEFESYKVLKNSSLDGETANLYEMTSKLINMNCSANSKSEFQTKRFLISKDGLLLKTENIYEDAEKKSLRRETTTYEYDPKIKIEAPIKP